MRNKNLEQFVFEIDPNQIPIRIDKFLFDKMPNVTRSRIQNGIKEKMVKVNGKTIKPSYKIKPLDELTVMLEKEKRDNTIKPEKIELKIVFEDDDIIIKSLGLFKPTFRRRHFDFITIFIFFIQKIS